MVLQAIWDRDHVLLQLPHFTPELAAKCDSAGIKSVFDLTDMDDEERRELLSMPDAALEVGLGFSLKMMSAFRMT